MLQSIEQLRFNNKAGFNYAGLRIIIGSEYQGFNSWDRVLTPKVEVFYKDCLLGHRESLPDALTYVFNGVRNCRPDLMPAIGEYRTDILMALSALSDVGGEHLSGHSNTPEISIRVQLKSDRVCTAIPDWDDRPTVMVYSSLSRGDCNDFESDSVLHRIVISEHGTTFTHEVRAPVYNQPDIYELVDDLVIKHFA